MDKSNEKKIRRKHFLPACFVASIILAGCNMGDKNKNTDVATDTASTAAAADAKNDSATAKPKKVRKGKASAMLSANAEMKERKDKEGVYYHTDVMPQYPGGESALSDFVSNHIEYPQQAMDDNANGTVTVSFVVDEKGKVIDPKVVGQTPGHGLDQEAMRVVQNMPAWKPGTVKGKPVKTRLQLPIVFKVDES